MKARLPMLMGTIFKVPVTWAALRRTRTSDSSERVPTEDDLRGARARLSVLRALGYVACVAEIGTFLGCFTWLCLTPSHIRLFLCGLGPVLIFFHLVPLVAFLVTGRAKHRVQEDGDSWTVGKYSEAQVRELARQCARLLPPRLGDLRIAIADYRATAGWTRLSLLWPRQERRRSVWISAGGLHYLMPDELQAVIVHEAAHHDPGNRGDVPGGWAMADLFLFCLVFLLGSRLRFGVFGLLALFFLLRLLLAWGVVGLQGKSAQMIEHLCDLYAARHVSREAMVNTLLKVGEEEELTESVVARAARELLHVEGIDADDLRLAFNDVRPYGRIFHDNLFRHASEIVTKVASDLKRTAKKPETRGRANIDLTDFLTRRREARQQRVRWRGFDGDGDGRLTEGEITGLCDALRKQPLSALFLCESERNPGMHPSFRSRILVLSRSA